MSKIITYNTCGPIETNSAWTQDFVEMIAEMAASRGTLMTYDEKEVEWTKWQRGSGSGTTNINLKHWIVQVGAPADTLSPFEEVDATAFNGNIVSVPDAIGLDVFNVRIGDQNAQPVSTGYQFNPNTGDFDFASSIGNTYLYFDTVTRSVIPSLEGTFFYGTKPDASPLDQSDIESGTLIGYTEGMDVTAPFTPSGLGLRYWAAWKSTDTTMSSYYVNSLDYGTIGAPGSTFEIRYTVGPYIVSETYPTSLSDTTFKHS